MSIKNIQAKLREVMQEVQDKGLAEFKEEFNDFFAEYPTVEAFRWQQYTPYFNDGEACEFGVHGIEIQLKGHTTSGYDDEDGFDEISTYDDIAMNAAIAEWFETLHGDGMKTVFEQVFGDHVRVTVTPDNIEIEEYEHD